MPVVLFVCTANRVRSPMAAEMFRALLKQKRNDWRHWQVESAGTWAMPGQPVVGEVQSVLARYGLDVSSHRSREVNGDILARADLILVMEKNQREALCVEYPEHCSRIYLLTEMTGQAHNVPDPIGGSLADYEQAAVLIQSLLEEGFERIVALTLQHSRERNIASGKE